MKKMSNDLKLALNALAYQDAPEFLSTGEKLEVLGFSNKKTRHPVKPWQHSQKIETPGRIALMADERDNNSLLEYAIDACERQGKNTHIDILLHEPINTANSIGLENCIKQVGLKYRLIQLGKKPVESLINYIQNNTASIFLIASSDDKVAKVLIEDVIPRSRERIQIPILLIEGKDSVSHHKCSAA